MSTSRAAIGQYSDLMFGILSTQDVYVVKAKWRFDAEPNGGSSISVFLEDNEMKVSDVIVGVGFVTGDNPGRRGRKPRIALRSRHLSYVLQAASA